MTKTTTDLTKSYSGIFGNQVVVRCRNGKSIITIPPRSQKKDPTENQVRARKMFRKASLYAKTVLEDPDMLALYAARADAHQTPYILAVTDYLKPPFVDQIDATGYQGNPGDTISIEAGDCFAVARVNVRILDASGTLIEQGLCAHNPKTAMYDYAATVPVPDLAGVTIVARVTDNPGHSAELSMTL